MAQVNYQEKNFVRSQTLLMMFADKGCDILKSHFINTSDEDTANTLRKLGF